jgi:poly(A) polymerase/tRNA nucleotidyltransferase (CCA-adding enzyme)
MHTLKINIPDDDRTSIQTVVDTFRRRGFECYLVGGSVRDLILDHGIYDFDFATNAHPGDVMKMFRRVIPTGIKHGTVSVLLNDRIFEITTYRSDGKYIDGRRPESVFFSDSLEEDVRRRDFTINGLAYDVERGEVLDYVDGLADLQQGIIRTIGDPIERFSEDGLRTYRACRFAARLNFTIEENTFNAISGTLDVAKLVSVERIRDEFNKLLEAERPSVGIEYFRRSGLLDLFLPELAQCYGVDQNRFHVFDVYYHSLYSCDAAPAKNLVIRLAALLHDIGKDPTRREVTDGESTFYNHEVIGARMVRRIMKRLRYSNEDSARVNNLILNHMFHYTEDWSDGAVRRFMRKVGLENIDDLVELRMADRRGNGSRDGLPAPILRLRDRMNKVIEDENAITVKDLNINGHDLMQGFHLKPGPVIGRILNELLEKVLDDPAINEHDALMSLSRDIMDRVKGEESGAES